MDSSSNSSSSTIVYKDSEETLQLVDTSFVREDWENDLLLENEKDPPQVINLEHQELYSECEKLSEEIYQKNYRSLVTTSSETANYDHPDFHSSAQTSKAEFELWDDAFSSGEQIDFKNSSRDKKVLCKRSFSSNFIDICCDEQIIASQDKGNIDSCVDLRNKELDIMPYENQDFDNNYFHQNTTAGLSIPLSLERCSIKENMSLIGAMSFQINEFKNHELENNNKAITQGSNLGSPENHGRTAVRTRNFTNLTIKQSYKDTFPNKGNTLSRIPSDNPESLENIKEDVSTLPCSFFSSLPLDNLDNNNPEENDRTDYYHDSVQFSSSVNRKDKLEKNEENNTQEKEDKLPQMMKKIKNVQKEPTKIYTNLSTSSLNSSFKQENVYSNENKSEKQSSLDAIVQPTKIASVKDQLCNDIPKQHSERKEQLSEVHEQVLHCTSNLLETKNAEITSRMYVTESSCNQLHSIISGDHSLTNDNLNAVKKEYSRHSIIEDATDFNSENIRFNHTESDHPLSQFLQSNKGISGKVYSKRCEEKSKKKQAENSIVEGSKPSISISKSKLDNTIEDVQYDLQNRISFKLHEPSITKQHEGYTFVEKMFQDVTSPASEGDYIYNNILGCKMSEKPVQPINSALDDQNLKMVKLDISKKYCKSQKPWKVFTDSEDSIGDSISCYSSDYEKEIDEIIQDIEHNYNSTRKRSQEIAKCEENESSEKRNSNITNKHYSGNSLERKRNLKEDNDSCNSHKVSPICFKGDGEFLDIEHTKTNRKSSFVTDYGQNNSSGNRSLLQFADDKYKDCDYNIKHNKIELRDKTDLRVPFQSEMNNTIRNKASSIKLPLSEADDYTDSDLYRIFEERKKDNLFITERIFDKTQSKSEVDAPMLFPRQNAKKHHTALAKIKQFFLSRLHKTEKYPNPRFTHLPEEKKHMSKTPFTSVFSEASNITNQFSRNIDSQLFITRRNENNLQRKAVLASKLQDGIETKYMNFDRTRKTMEMDETNQSFAETIEEIQQKRKTHFWQRHRDYKQEPKMIYDDQVDNMRYSKMAKKIHPSPQSKRYKTRHPRLILQKCTNYNQNYGDIRELPFQVRNTNWEMTSSEIIKHKRRP